MQSIRAVPLTALVAVLALAACGSPAATSPATQSPGGTLPPAPTGSGPVASATGGLSPDSIPATLLATAFGGAVPEPDCGELALSGTYCRWEAADESVVVDVQRDPSLASEEAFRTAFEAAGFDEELTELGVPALGGRTPLSAGYRVAAYGPDNVAYSVTLTSDGDPAILKALTISLVGALVNPG